MAHQHNRRNFIIFSILGFPIFAIFVGVFGFFIGCQYSEYLTFVHPNRTPWTIPFGAGHFSARATYALIALCVECDRLVGDDHTPRWSAGDRFYEIQGALISFKQLSNDDWAFHTPVSAWELPLMGFDPKTLVSASHVTVKTTTYEGTTDTDHVSRTSTIQWKTSEGLLKDIQFVSLKGFHTRLAK